MCLGGFILVCFCLWQHHKIIQSCDKKKKWWKVTRNHASLDLKSSNEIFTSSWLFFYRLFEHFWKSVCFGHNNITPGHGLMVSVLVPLVKIPFFGMAQKIVVRPWKKLCSHLCNHLCYLLRLSQPNSVTGKLRWIFKIFILRIFQAYFWNVQIMNYSKIYIFHYGKWHLILVKFILHEF